MLTRGPLPQSIKRTLLSCTATALLAFGTIAGHSAEPHSQLPPAAAAAASRDDSIPSPADAAQVDPAQAAPQALPAHGRRKENEIIVQFKTTAADAEIADAVAKGGLGLRKHVQTSAMKAKGHPGLTHATTALPVDEALRLLKNHPAVEFAEPNWIYTHQASANDPYFTSGYLWGDYGDLGSPNNAFGSQAAEAWAAGYVGTNTVFVGIIDEGIQYTHPDLAPNAWTNPFDRVDGIDNDGNGYVDDSHGWNFYGNNNAIFDPAGDHHGTHVAGTVGAKGGNGVGVAGVNWNVTFISAKFLGANGGTTIDAIEAIDYFTDLKLRHGLDIVALNNSWGGGGYSQALHDAILRAAKAGILFVAAAGNGDANGNGLNNDTTANYPSNYDTRQGTSTESAASYDAVIAVAAIDSNGAKATFSNYGAKQVDLGAPGVAIYSTLPTDTYGGYSGTSMATPHVTGAVALYASTHPLATALEIRNAILGSVTPTASLSGITVTGGRLNLSAIVTPSADPQPTRPAAPAGLVATAGSLRVSLSWNSVSDATSYAVKRSTVSGGPYTVIASSLTTATYVDTAVQAGTNYYYVVVAVNAAGVSPDSAAVSATPFAGAPAVPSGVTASSTKAQVNGNATATVKWTASSGATSYQVKRATASAGPYTVVASGLTTTSYTGAVTASGTSYYYVVSAVNSAGESANSSAASVAPLPPTPRNLTATAASRSQINISWLDECSDETGFKVEMYDGGTWRQLGTVTSNVTTIGITGLARHQTYYFRVRAYNSYGNTAYSNVASARTLH